MDEALALAAIGRQLASAGLFEALNDGLQTGSSVVSSVVLHEQHLAGVQPDVHRLAGAILPHDECEGLVKLDHVRVFRAEAPDALDEQLHRGHVTLWIQILQSVDAQSRINCESILIYAVYHTAMLSVLLIAGSFGSMGARPCRWCTLQVTCPDQGFHSQQNPRVSQQGLSPD